jgi:hypothetical protein
MDFRIERGILTKMPGLIRIPAAETAAPVLSVDSQLPLVIEYPPLLMNDVLDRLSMNSDFKRILFTMKSSKE